MSPIALWCGVAVEIFGKVFVSRSSVEVPFSSHLGIREHTFVGETVTGFAYLKTRRLPFDHHCSISEPDASFNATTNTTYCMAPTLTVRASMK